MITCHHQDRNRLLPITTSRNYKKYKTNRLQFNVRNKTIAISQLKINWNNYLCFCSQDERRWDPPIQLNMIILIIMRIAHIMMMMMIMITRRIMLMIMRDIYNTIVMSPAPVWSGLLSATRISQQHTITIYPIPSTPSICSACQPHHNHHHLLSSTSP